MSSKKLSIFFRLRVPLELVCSGDFGPLFDDLLLQSSRDYHWEDEEDIESAADCYEKREIDIGKPDGASCGDYYI